MDHKLEIALVSLAQAFLVVGQKHSKKLSPGEAQGNRAQPGPSPDGAEASAGARGRAGASRNSDGPHTGAGRAASRTAEASQTPSGEQATTDARPAPGEPEQPAGDVGGPHHSDSRDEELRALIRLQQGQIAELQTALIGQGRVMSEQRMAIERLSTLLETNLKGQAAPTVEGPEPANETRAPQSSAARKPEAEPVPGPETQVIDAELVDDVPLADAKVDEAPHNPAIRPESVDVVTVEPHRGEVASDDCVSANVAEEATGPPGEPIEPEPPTRQARGGCVFASRITGGFHRSLTVVPKGG